MTILLVCLLKAVAEWTSFQNPNNVIYYYYYYCDAHGPPCGQG